MIRKFVNNTYFMKLLFPFFALLIVLSSCETPTNVVVDTIITDSIIVKDPILEYGFNLDSFQVIRDTVQQNWTLSHLLAPYGISQFNINQSADPDDLYLQVLCR